MFSHNESSIKINGLDSIIDYNQLVAIKMFQDGFNPSISSGICGSLTVGYGILDENGYWEYSLPSAYWTKSIADLSRDTSSSTDEMLTYESKITDTGVMIKLIPLKTIQGVVGAFIYYEHSIGQDIKILMKMNHLGFTKSMVDKLISEMNNDPDLVVIKVSWVLDEADELDDSRLISLLLTDIQLKTSEGMSKLDNNQRVQFLKNSTYLKFMNYMINNKLVHRQVEDIMRHKLVQLQQLIITCSK